MKKQSNDILEQNQKHVPVKKKKNKKKGNNWKLTNSLECFDHARLHT